jgi:hypothetical protein
MNNDRTLTVRKELEALVEAQAEMLRSDKRPTAQRYMQLHNEINARAWAAYYVVSYPTSECRPENYDEVLATAAMYDSWEPHDDEVVQ